MDEISVGSIRLGEEAEGEGSSSRNEGGGGDVATTSNGGDEVREDSPAGAEERQGNHGHAHLHGHAHIHAHAHGHTHAPPPPGGPQPRNMAQQRAAGNSNQLGVVRDRLFQAMLVRLALAYASRVTRRGRRLFEFFTLMVALGCFVTLILVHVLFTKTSPTCLNELNEVWPRDGILRLEIVRNLDVLREKEEAYARYKAARRAEAKNPPVCEFNVIDVLRYGTGAVPQELRDDKARESAAGKGSTLLQYLLPELFAHTRHLMDEDDWEDEEEEGLVIEALDEDEEAYALDFERAFNALYHNDPLKLPLYEYRVDYSLIYGLLRLPKHFLRSHNVSLMTHQVDANSECFGPPLARYLMKNGVGYEDVAMSALRALAVNESDIGYVHDLRTNDHYHFVSLATTKMSYITAFIVMLLFTFAISLLLRFSHHQIFLFIVDLLHMFENNQPLAFPAAPLLTVILALVGMEAIMSEVFSDTTTAFYVILIVWLADQFDAICCQSPTSKRYWLRFFYLYQFFFYAYQYRFAGQYGSLALLTSSMFILHSMVFFFHHYEIPLILYSDRLSRIMSELNHRELAALDVRGAAEIAAGRHGMRHATHTLGVHHAGPLRPPRVLVRPHRTLFNFPPPEVQSVPALIFFYTRDSIRIFSRLFSGQSPFVFHGLRPFDSSSSSSSLPRPLTLRTPDGSLLGATPISREDLERIDGRIVGGRPEREGAEAARVQIRTATPAVLNVRLEGGNPPPVG